MDTALGVPAVGIRITLDFASEQGGAALVVPISSWVRVGDTITNSDGRGPGLSASLTLQRGVYRCIFHTQEYFDRLGTPTFYPYAEIVFRIVAPDQHYHIPLLISPYAYSTYRGS